MPVFNLGDRRIGIEVAFLYLRLRPSRSTKMLSMQRPPRLRGGRLLPSMLIVTSCRFRRPVKSSLVNWLPPAFARAGSGRY
jgi:hypothetical protein